jgi:hypothetical protein
MIHKSGITQYQKTLRDLSPTWVGRGYLQTENRTEVQKCFLATTCHLLSVGMTDQLTVCDWLKLSWNGWLRVRGYFVTKYPPQFDFQVYLPAKLFICQVP